jgi:AcrR family transcriptional regulator
VGEQRIQDAKTYFVSFVMNFDDTTGNICQVAYMMQPEPISEREATILNAALHAFSSYGFRRTTMEDIAQGAGLARTALYQTYRNKEEIFRSLVQAYFDQALFDMRSALAQADMTLDAALMACLVARDGKFMEVILTSPHGYELLDAGFAVSRDLAAAGEAHMAAILAEWLALQGVPEAIGPAPALADTVMAALKGIRAQAHSMEELRSGEMRLANLVGRALL